MEQWYSWASTASALSLQCPATHASSRLRRQRPSGLVRPQAGQPVGSTCSSLKLSHLQERKEERKRVWACKPCPSATLSRGWRLVFSSWVHLSSHPQPCPAQASQASPSPASRVAEGHQGGDLVEEAEHGGGVVQVDLWQWRQAGSCRGGAGVPYTPSPHEEAKHGGGVVQVDLHSMQWGLGSGPQPPALGSPEEGGVVEAGSCSCRGVWARALASRPLPVGHPVPLPSSSPLQGSLRWPPWPGPALAMGAWPSSASPRGSSGRPRHPSQWQTLAAHLPPTHTW